jgi:hypothetical protein
MRVPLSCRADCYIEFDHTRTGASMAIELDVDCRRTYHREAMRLLGSGRPIAGATARLMLFDLRRAIGRHLSWRLVIDDDGQAHLERGRHQTEGAMGIHVGLDRFGVLAVPS